MKRQYVMRVLLTGLLVFAFYLPQAYGFTNPFELCTTGPGTLVTGDTLTFNGLTYRVVVGTAGNDTLYGLNDPNTSERDVIWGLDGDDVLHGGNGDDILCGGPGADTLWGEAGNDTLWGDIGNDTLHGGDGSDRLDGANGDDFLYGEGGDDSDRITISSGVTAGLYGGDGNDWMSGGDGNDWLAGQNGNDTMFGDKGDDEMGGGPDYDTIDGGSGKDACEAEVVSHCEKPLFP